jgi:Integrase core domain
MPERAPRTRSPACMADLITPMAIRGAATLRIAYRVDAGTRTAAALAEAVQFYARHAVTVERVLTDNGSSYCSAIHAIACSALRIRHARTLPCRPQTNGKAGRFIRTLLAGWAHGAVYGNSTERAATLGGWLWYYNHQRRHSALAHKPPIARLTEPTNLLETYTYATPSSAATDAALLRFGRPKEPDAPLSPRPVRCKGRARLPARTPGRATGYGLAGAGRGGRVAEARKMETQVRHFVLVMAALVGLALPASAAARGHTIETVFTRSGRTVLLRFTSSRDRDTAIRGRWRSIARTPGAASSATSSTTRASVRRWRRARWFAPTGPYEAVSRST